MLPAGNCCLLTSLGWVEQPLRQCRGCRQHASEGVLSSACACWLRRTIGPNPSGVVTACLTELLKKGMTGTCTMNTSECSAERGSGNVFADLDLPDAESHLLTAEFVSRIDDILRQRGTTRAEAARALGLPQLDLSRLRCATASSPSRTASSCCRSA